MGGCAGQGNSEMVVWSHQSITDGQSADSIPLPASEHPKPSAPAPLWAWAGTGGVPAHTSAEKGTRLQILLRHLAPPRLCGAELWGSSSPRPSALPRGTQTPECSP